MIHSDLVDLCKFVGSQTPHWVQGAGGNISVKDGSHLYIKASGIRLANVSEEYGIAEVDFNLFNSGFKKIGTCKEKE